MSNRVLCGQISHITLFESSSENHFILKYIIYLSSRHRYFLLMYNYEERYRLLLAEIQSNMLNQYAFSRNQTQITGSALVCTFNWANKEEEATW